MKPTNLIGKTFGRLSVTSRTTERRGKRRRSIVLWGCVCECGGNTRAMTNNLTRGTTISCGCVQRERTGDAQRIHGSSETRLYYVWRSMINRCENPNVEHYYLYGARGITVCDQWRRSFERFARDVGSRPSNKHSIDRIDNDGNYEPGNVRWATAKEQASNKRAYGSARPVPPRRGA